MRPQDATKELASIKADLATADNLAHALEVVRRLVDLIEAMMGPNKEE